MSSEVGSPSQQAIDAANFADSLFSEALRQGYPPYLIFKGFAALVGHCNPQVASVCLMTLDEFLFETPHA